MKSKIPYIVAGGFGQPQHQPGDFFAGDNLQHRLPQALRVRFAAFAFEGIERQGESFAVIGEGKADALLPVIYG